MLSCLGRSGSSCALGCIKSAMERACPCPRGTWTDSWAGTQAMVNTEPVTDAGLLFPCSPDHQRSGVLNRYMLRGPLPHMAKKTKCLEHSTSAVLEGADLHDSGLVGLRWHRPVPAGVLLEMHWHVWLLPLLPPAAA